MKRQGQSRKNRALASVPLLLMLSACVSPQLVVRPMPRADGASDAGAQAADGARPDVESRIEMLRNESSQDALIAPPRRAAPEISVDQIDALVGDEQVDVTLPAQPLPQFVDTVFGQVLEVPYTLGPGVAERLEVVALRGSVTVSKRSFFIMVQTALRDYGVALSVENGIVRVFRDEVLTSQAPRLVRERTLPDDVNGSQAVIQFFELQSIDVNSLMSLLQDTYPSARQLRMTPRQDINSLVISGSARDVASAAEIINQIDQPRFAGAQVARIEPIYWSPSQLANSVVTIMSTEGYQAAVGSSSIQRAVTFLPIPNTNQLLLFSNLPEAFGRAVYWIEELDQPSALGDQENVFVYQVQNADAAELGALVGTAGVTAPGPQAQADAGQANNGAARSSAPIAAGRITIDPVGNRLLYRGTPSEFARARDLMEELDTPPRQVMIEMTIAEVTLTDETRFGVEWELSQIVNGNDEWTGGTSGGLGLGTSGLVLEFAHPDVRAALNAYASNNNVNILSTPRLVARSGGEAEIQVGTDVPVITSQQGATTQTSGRTDILQTVQYRRTGVILNVRPIVLGDNRVDIEIVQEVSAAQSNTTADISSPLILNRNVRTQISLQEGSTAVIGGLIQDAYSRGNQGIPVLKDLPFVGQIFRTDTVGADRTELLVLITPHIVDDDELAQSARNLSRQLNRGLARRGPHAYTLLPWAPPLRLRRTHGGQDILSAPQPGWPFGRRGGAEANEEAAVPDMSAPEGPGAQAPGAQGPDAQAAGPHDPARRALDTTGTAANVPADAGGGQMPAPAPAPEGPTSLRPPESGAQMPAGQANSAAPSNIHQAAVQALQAIVDSPTSGAADVASARAAIAALIGH